VNPTIKPSNATRKHKFKPTVIPDDDFVLIVDTREQKPLFESPPDGLTIVKKALKHGDYSLVGFESMLSVERKQMSDFISYIGRERKKTETKLQHLGSMYFAALVIEVDDPFDIPSYTGTSITPEHIRGFMASCRIRHGIHIYWTSKRKAMERYILDHLAYAYKQLRSV